MRPLKERVLESTRALKAHCPYEEFPKTAVVLGSGFKAFAEEVKSDFSVSFSEIPFFKAPQVAGHGQNILFVKLGNRFVVILSGRIHLYEGFTVEEIVHPVRTLAHCGIENILLTNASGGLSKTMRAGDVALIEDQINFMGVNCLCGEGVDELGPRFVDMVGCYDLAWRSRIRKAVPKLKKGIYLGALGPSYETPAEVGVFSGMGANIVGMSTVQETIAARQLNLKVAGLSLITNLAGGLGGAVSHDGVVKQGQKNQKKLIQILDKALRVSPA